MLTQEQIEAVAAEFDLDEEELGEAVLDACHRAASDRYNSGAAQDLDDEDAHELLHGQADRQASDISNGGPGALISFLAQYCTTQDELRRLLGGLAS
ncbi:hypothetical protein [Streptomyces luteireticuli]|uniref:hypothetical protein n=1 Tax=Streptomyces luteireticuli TaxID=173858 RepID=UPI0035586DC2